MTSVYTDYYWIQPRLIHISHDDMCQHRAILDTASVIHISLDDVCLHWPVLDTSSVKPYQPRSLTCVYTDCYWIQPRLIHISIDDMCPHWLLLIQPRLFHISLDDMCLHWSMLETASLNPYRSRWNTCVNTDYYWIQPQLIHIGLDDVFILTITGYSLG